MHDDSHDQMYDEKHDMNRSSAPIRPTVSIAALSLTLAAAALSFRSAYAAGDDAASAKVATGAAGSAPATDVSQADLRAIWDDPTFQKQFVGGYGINSEIEPRVSKEEVAILEKVRPLVADNRELAETALRKAMKPGCSAILDFTLGGILFQQEKLDDALACYRTAVEKFPSFRRAYRNIGLIATRKSDFDGAIAAFNRMIELGGADAYSYGLLAFAHSSKQDFQPAEAAYRNALLLQPANTEWRLGLTRTVFKQGKYQDAAALLDSLIEQYPDKADFWSLQAYTFIGMKEPMKAATNLEALDVLGKSTLDTLYTLGDIYLTENLPALAFGAYERAVKKSAEQPAARPMRCAEQLAARGGAAQARQLAALVKTTWGATMADAEKTKLLKLEARLSMADGGGDDATVAILEDILKIDPLDGEALMLLGQHYSRHGKPEKAMLAYERAAGIDQFAAAARVKQAQILVSQSRPADAIPLLRQAQEIKPREDVARYLEQVERLAKARR
jgi:tetratricopeptide (TPR) repeat protein